MLTTFLIISMIANLVLVAYICAYPNSGHYAKKDKTFLDLAKAEREIHASPLNDSVPSSTKQDINNDCFMKPQDEVTVSEEPRAVNQN